MNCGSGLSHVLFLLLKLAPQVVLQSPQAENLLHPPSIAKTFQNQFTPTSKVTFNLGSLHPGRHLLVDDSTFLFEDVSTDWTILLQLDLQENKMPLWQVLLTAIFDNRTGFSFSISPLACSSSVLRFWVVTTP